MYTEPTTKNLRSPASGQSGFVMLLVIMTSLAFSLFAAAQINEAGASLVGSQFAQRAISRMDATRTAAVFCAQVGTRHYSGAVSLTTTWTSDDVFYDMLSVSTLKSSLVTSVQDGYAVLDAASSTGAAKIRLGRRPDGTYDPYAQTWFVDPDFVGSYTYTGTTGTGIGGGMTDCAGGGSGGYLCSTASTVFTETGAQVAASMDSNEYNLLPCNVLVQLNKHVNTDGSLNATKPFQTYMVSFRHDYKRPTGDRL